MAADSLLKALSNTVAMLAIMMQPECTVRKPKPAQAAIVAF
jgi:hypothetical protein